MHDAGDDRGDDLADGAGRYRRAFPVGEQAAIDATGGAFMMRYTAVVVTALRSGST